MGFLNINYLNNFQQFGTSFQRLKNRHQNKKSQKIASPGCIFVKYEEEGWSVLDICQSATIQVSSDTKLFIKSCDGPGK